MTSSAAPEAVSADIVSRARALSPLPVLDVVQANAGGNSRLYRVDCAGGRFALKSYPARAQDPRDRLGVEFRALRFMREHGIRDVPQAIAADEAAGLALHDWVEGGPVGNPGAADIDAAARFLGQLHGLRRAPGADALPSGSEACLSGTELRRQVQVRRERLHRAAPDEPALAAFLEGEFAPALAAILGWAEAGYRRRGLDFDLPVPADARSLCPSDFGFHNAIRRPDGSLAFIDFEYFGWDDPVKLVSDFLLHPGMQMDEAARRRFAAAIRPVYGGDPAFSARLELLYPLFGLRWCMILLNEFLPERWANRVHSGGGQDWRRAKERQLGRADALLRRLREGYQRFAYAD